MIIALISTVGERFQIVMILLLTAAVSFVGGLILARQYFQGYMVKKGLAEYYFTGDVMQWRLKPKLEVEK